MLSASLLLCALFLLPIIEAAKKYQSCSPYPYVIIDHGDISQVGSQTYSFRCDNGYFLAAPSKVRCFRGNWTYTKEPKCLRRGGLCDDPPGIENGIILGDDRNVGDKITYMCNDGFILMGKAERVCSQSGHWNGRTPVCMDEKEPLQQVAERLKHSFVTELEKSTDGAPEGRLLDEASLKEGLELVILIDRSSSVDPVQFEDAKNFTKFLLKRFNVKNGKTNKGGTRAAVLAFGTEIQLVFNVDNKTINGPQAASKAIDSIQPNGGGTNMEGALTDVLLNVVHHLRPKAKRALFMMTDGEPNIANPEITPQNMANHLKKNFEFEIFTVGVGKDINRRLLAELASEPPLSHVFVLESYKDVNDIMKVIENEEPKVVPISKDQCGYDAPNEDRPWLATIYVGGDSLKMCGGVLICSQWILTAASCIEEKNSRTNIQDIFVSLGQRHLLKADVNQTNFYVTDIRIHPAFDPDSVLRENLALLKLNLPAARYRPACLPRLDDIVPLHKNLKVNASIAGWGLTSGNGATQANGGTVSFTMSSTPVSLAEEHECPEKKHDMSLLCAGQGIKSCFGLTGSPLIAVDSMTSFNHVIGTMAGRKHCIKGHNQYVELTKYIGWINQQTDDCQTTHWGLQN